MNRDLPDYKAPNLSKKDTRFTKEPSQRSRLNSSVDAYYSATDSPSKKLSVKELVSISNQKSLEK